MTCKTVTLKEKTLIDTDLYKIVFEFPEGEKIEFEPGQFMSIDVGNGVRRSYSLSNVPSENTVLETYADVSPHGPAYDFFSKAEVGEEADVLVPLGQFKMKDGDEPAYFLGMGTGIVPFLSMIRHELDEKKTGRSLHLYSGVRNEKRLICADLLNDLSLNHENFIYKQYVSQPEGKTKYKVGRITANLTELIDESAHYYICGGREVILEVEENLLKNGIPEHHIFYERYY